MSIDAAVIRVGCRALSCGAGQGPGEDEHERVEVTIRQDGMFRRSVSSVSQDAWRAPVGRLGTEARRELGVPGQDVGAALVTTDGVPAEHDPAGGWHPSSSEDPPASSLVLRPRCPLLASRGSRRSSSNRSRVEPAAAALQSLVGGMPGALGEPISRALARADDRIRTQEAPAEAGASCSWRGAEIRSRLFAAPGEEAPVPSQESPGCSPEALICAGVRFPPSSLVRN